MQIRPIEEWEDNDSNEYVSDEETYTDMRLFFRSTLIDKLK